MDEDNLIKQIDFLKKKLTNVQKQNDYIISELNLIKSLVLNNNPIMSEQNYCPICGELSVFEPFGEKPRMNARCPNCGSVERHRMVYILLKKRYYDLLTNQNITLLHFAPEKFLYDFFMEHKNIDYYPVDYNPQLYEHKLHIRDKVNMEDIPYEDNKFDFIYNCHVLEHVPDDIKAMSELYRVLKKDGVCITLVPYFTKLKETLEKEEYNTPELRFKYYGQHDHLRKYGLDFKDRLESVGFNVELVKLSDITTSKTDIKLFKLVNDTFFICTK